VIGDRESPSTAAAGYRASLSPMDASTSNVAQFESPQGSVFRGVDDIRPNVPAKRPHGFGRAGLSSGSDIRIQLADPGSIPSFQFSLV